MLKFLSFLVLIKDVCVCDFASANLREPLRPSWTGCWGPFGVNFTPPTVLFAILINGTCGSHESLQLEHCPSSANIPICLAATAGRYHVVEAKEKKGGEGAQGGQGFPLRRESGMEEEWRMEMYLEDEVESRRKLDEQKRKLQKEL